MAVAMLLVFGGSLAGARRSVSVTSLPPASAPAVRAASEATIAIPVLGITREDLRDTFGEPRGSSRTHQGMDILSERGTPVLAAVDGSIIKLYESGAGGRTIYLSDEHGETVYYYAHLDAYAEGLEEAAQVERGEVIGFVGTTGNAPRNVPHLHFSIEHLPAGGEWWKGDAVNPYPILMSEGFTVAQDR